MNFLTLRFGSLLTTTLFLALAMAPAAAAVDTGTPLDSTLKRLGAGDVDTGLPAYVDARLCGDDAAPTHRFFLSADGVALPESPVAVGEYCAIADAGSDGGAAPLAIDITIKCKLRWAWPPITCEVVITFDF